MHTQGYTGVQYTYTGVQRSAQAEDDKVIVLTKKHFSLSYTVRFSLFGSICEAFETALEAFVSITVFAYLSSQCQNGAK
jgi:uncharacterized membrane protein